MKKFAISWISFFDNELHIDFVQCSTVMEALTEALLRVSCFTYVGVYSEDKIKEVAFDLDTMIEAKEII